MLLEKFYQCCNRCSSCMYKFCKIKALTACEFIKIVAAARKLTKVLHIAKQNKCFSAKSEALNIEYLLNHYKSWKCIMKLK